MTFAEIAEWSCFAEQRSRYRYGIEEVARLVARDEMNNSNPIESAA